MKKKIISIVFVGVMVVSLMGCTVKKTVNITKKEEIKITNILNQQKKKDDKENKNLKSPETPIFIVNGIRRVTIENKGKTTLDISYRIDKNESSFKFWRVYAPYKSGEVTVNTENLYKYFAYLQSLDFTGKANGIDTKTAGIDESSTSIELNFCETTNEEKIAVMGGVPFDSKTSPSAKEKADSRIKLIIGNEDGKGSYYAALENNKENILIMSKNTIDAILNVNSFDLILKIPAVLDITTVKEVLAYVEEKRYSISEEKLEEEEGKKLYQDILGIMVEDEVNDDIKVNKEKPILKLYFKRTKKEFNNLTIEYYKYDDKYAVAIVNGSADFLVKLEDVKELSKKVSK